MAGFGGRAEAGWLLTWGPSGRASLKVVDMVDMWTTQMCSSKHVADQSVAPAARARVTEQVPAASSACRDLLPVSTAAAT